MAQPPITVLIPAYKDFDPTEIAIPWKLMTEYGKSPTHPGLIRITFTTIDGQPAECDPLVLKGPIFGFFGASKEAKKAYEEMLTSKEFLQPLKWEDTDLDAYDGVWLGGGHAKGVREYLDSKVLQSKLARYMPKTKAGAEDSRVLAAICHGPVLLSRSIDDSTGKSVLAGRKTSCLPYHMERDAYNLTRFHLGDYYRTYPTYVQHEVEASGAREVSVGPKTIMARLLGKVNIPYTVEDGESNYVYARWP
jgi:putative intracellular protease/amidase